VITNISASDKVKGFDLILNYLNEFTQTSGKPTVYMVGSLNKAQGINGFKKAEIGTPVFETDGKYFIMLESLDGKRNLEVFYYKDSLAPVIDFITLQ